LFSFNGAPLAQRSNSGGVGRDGAVLLERGQLAILVTLILLTAGAWGLTFLQAQSMPGKMAVVVAPAGSGDAMTAMAGMADSGAAGTADMAEAVWGFGGLVAFVVAWTVMMVAMMLPGVAPMVLLYRAIAAKSMPNDTAFVATGILVAGYLLVWTAVGGGVYGIVRLGGELADRFGVTAHERWAALALGAVLVIAGLYQFTPLKHACLRQCQSPFGFIMGHWRGGRLGALRMGVVHGLYCLGCCWALFAVLVAAGVMSLAWMLLLTLVVFAEKVLPIGRRTANGVGAAFLVLGILVASGMVAMPGVI
jgi:predicted metal-binding membrane protein